MSDFDVLTLAVHLEKPHLLGFLELTESRLLFLERFEAPFKAGSVVSAT